jgi:hypothetical protein
MVETVPSLQQAQLHARMTAAVACLARQRAIAVVKHQLRARGLKVHSFAHREIVVLANEYAQAHRAELIEEAKPIVEQWRKAGFFGKRAAIQNPHCEAS